jgi:hypothetical protein
MAGDLIMPPPRLPAIFFGKELAKLLRGGLKTGQVRESSFACSQDHAAIKSEFGEEAICCRLPLCAAAIGTLGSASGCGEGETRDTFGRHKNGGMMQMMDTRERL